MCEKVDILDRFYLKVRKSGHSHQFAREIFVEALVKFKCMVRNSSLPAKHPNYAPLYLSNDYDEVNRKINKFLWQFNWYVPGSGMSNTDWKNEIPRDFKSKTLRICNLGHRVHPNLSYLYLIPIMVYF